MRVSIIAALDKHGVVGYQGKLPWHLPDELKYFRKVTLGKCVVMGRKTLESLPAGLPGRTAVVLSRTPGYTCAHAIHKHSLQEALAWAQGHGHTEVVVIGGGELYAAALAHAHVMYLTYVDAEVVGDTYFPAWDKHAWQERERTHHSQDARHAYAFDMVVLHRKKSHEKQDMPKG